MELQQDNYQIVRHLIFTRTGKQIGQQEFQIVNAILAELADLTGATNINKFLNILAREPNDHQLWQYLIAQLDVSTHTH